MKTLIALALLTLALPQTPTKVKDASNLEFTQFSYTRKMITRERLVSEMVSYKPPVLDKSTIKLLDRSPDEKNNPLLTVQRDTSQRMQDLNTLGSRATKSTGGVPEQKVLVYEFQAQMRNYSPKPVTSFAWAYRWAENSQDFPDQEYLCNVAIRPGEKRPVKLISPIPRPRVVNVSASAAPPSFHPPELQDMVINQIEYADGTTWRRSDWNAILLTRVGARKLRNGKCLAL